MIAGSQEFAEQGPGRSTISVVIPAYNGARFLNETLQSVFQQSRLPDEVVVVDDCSTDDTLAEASRIASTAPIPVMVIRRSINSGSPAGPLNEGIARARGDLIAVLDQDDVFTAAKIQRQSEMLESRGDVGLVGGLVASFGSSTAQPGPVIMRRTAEKMREAMQAEDGFYTADSRLATELLIRREQVFLGFPGFMFRRALWSKAGGIDDRYRIAADYQFLLALTRQAGMAFVPQVHYLRRTHAENLTRNETRRLAEVLVILLRELRSVDDPTLAVQVRRAVLKKLAGFSAHMAAIGCWIEAGEICRLKMKFASAHGEHLRAALAISTLPYRAEKRRRKALPREKNPRADCEEGMEKIRALLRAS